MGIEVSFHMTDCAICGQRSATNYAVLGARGYFCAEHAPRAVRGSNENRDRQLQSMITSGNFSLPLPLWDPE